jgi:hypothetical protein
MFEDRTNGTQKYYYFSTNYIIVKEGYVTYE